MEEYTGIFFKYRELNPYNNFNTKKVKPMHNTQTIYFNYLINNWLNLINAEITSAIIETPSQEFYNSKIIHKTEFKTPGLS